MSVCVSECVCVSVCESVCVSVSVCTHIYILGMCISITQHLDA